MANKPCKNCIHKEACITANPNMVKKTYHCEHYLPTANVVQVVRCKGCKYSTKEMIGDDLEFICKSAEGMVNPAPDKYCSCGERRDT